MRSEDLFGIREIEAMPMDVCLAFLFIQLKTHENLLPSRSLQPNKLFYNPLYHIQREAANPTVQKSCFLPVLFQEAPR